MGSIKKYVGTYRVLLEKTLNGKNGEFTYIPCKYNSKMYRYSKNKIALELVTSNSRNIIVPQLKDYLSLFIEGDYESVWLFDEKDIHKVASVVKPRVKGKYIKPGNKYKTQKKKRNKKVS